MVCVGVLSRTCLCGLCLGSVVRFLNLETLRYGHQRQGRGPAAADLAPGPAQCNMHVHMCTHRYMRPAAPEFEAQATPWPRHRTQRQRGMSPRGRAGLQACGRDFPTAPPHRPPARPQLPQALSRSCACGCSAGLNGHGRPSRDSGTRQRKS